MVVNSFKWKTPPTNPQPHPNHPHHPNPSQTPRKKPHLPATASTHDQLPHENQTNASPTASPKQRSTQVYSKASLTTHLDVFPFSFSNFEFFGDLILFNSFVEGKYIYIYVCEDRGGVGGWGEDVMNGL